MDVQQPRYAHKSNVSRRQKGKNWLEELFILSFDAFRMVRIYNKLHRSLWTIGWVLLRDWEWTHNNLDMLISNMSPEDKKVGAVVICSIHSEDFLTLHFLCCFPNISLLQSPVLSGCTRDRKTKFDRNRQLVGIEISIRWVGESLTGFSCSKVMGDSVTV